MKAKGNSRTTEHYDAPNTKLLDALGTMLLLSAFPNNPLAKWFTHFLPSLKGASSCQQPWLTADS